ncbi:unnamed protein product [Ectocarpus sp. 6 AP-2014]
MPDGRAIRNGVSVPGGGTVGSRERPDELVGTAVALLHEMTVGGSECAPDKMSFELVMQACVNAGRPESALKVFRAMARVAAGGGSAVGGGGGSGERRGSGRGRAVEVRPDRATFRLGLTAAAEAGDGPAAAVLLEEMRDAGIAMDESAFHLAATAFGRAGLWRQGVRVAVVAAEQGIALAPTTLTSILGACAKQARWREALGLLQGTRPVLQQGFSSLPLSTGAGVVAGTGRRGEGNVVAAYTLAMVACRRSGRHSEGLRVLEMLEEDGGVGDEAFFRVALKCCAKAGGVGERGECSGAAVADRVLEGMSAQGIRCGVEGFTDIAQAYGLAGRWEDALALLPRAAALAAVPDERMYCSVINAMGESGAWEAAVELIQSMRRRRRPSAAATAGGSGGGTSDSGASGVAAAAVVSLSLEPPPPGRAAYGCACRACARKGEWGAVLGLMEDMREDGLERDSSVYASAMRAFVEAGDWERAVEIVTVEMERDGVSPDALSFGQALRACRAGADGSGRAAQLALELVGEVRSRGLEPGVVILESAARACLADDRPELALDIVSETLDSWRRGSLGGDGDGGGGKRWGIDEVQRLETMRITVLGRLGRWEDSLEALDAMRAKFGDDDLDERAFVSAARACAAAGEWSLIQVLQSEASAVADGDGVSPGSAWDMQRALLSGLTTAGMWRRSMGMLREMHHRGGGDTVMPAAGEERGQGMPDPSPHWQRRMFKDHRSVMHACLRAGAWDKALSVWSDLRSIVEGPVPCGRTYTAALRACGPLGLWATARDLLSEMRDGAEGAEGDGLLLLPEARHYAFAVSAATVADDISSDEEATLSGRGGWGGGGSDAVVDGDGSSGSTALRSVLSDMAAATGGGVEIGWETYAAVCWARSQRKQWHRASLGVLELMGEHGFGDGALGTEEAAEGMRSLYRRLLAAASKIPRFATGAGGTQSAAPARNATRQVLLDAEERLASVPGGAGPQVLAAAATAFARAGDWEGARDIAVRFDPRVGGPTVGGASSGTGEPSAVRRRRIADAAAVVSVAVAATARAEELVEAEALAELARVIATTAEVSASTSGGGATGGGSRSRGSDGEEARVSRGTERSNNPLGFDHRAGVALADAYERAGRLSDAEGLRSRLQGRMASSLGLEEAAGVEGGVAAAAAAAAAAAVPRLPSVGGHSRRRRPPAEGDEPMWPPDEEAGVDDEQYDLFLQWMATGEEEDEEEEEGEGDTWLGDDDDDDVLVAGPPRESDEEGLTIRELEGW